MHFKLSRSHPPPPLISIIQIERRKRLIKQYMEMKNEEWESLTLLKLLTRLDCC